MQVASLELCKELYELSGWVETDKFWRTNGKEKWLFDGDNMSVNTLQQKSYPAYDAGFLLRKLPSGVTLFINSNAGDPNDYSIKYEHNRWVSAFTPENATALLAIKLFEQGVLTKEQLREG